MLNCGEIPDLLLYA